jgi:transcription elongation GreA/GreB family factor
MAVVLAREDGTELAFRIVGEDEADPAQGRIAWTAPVARVLLGAAVGDLRRLPTGEHEILAIDPTPEPPP